MAQPKKCDPSPFCARYALPPMRRSLVAMIAVPLLLASGACTGWLFSGVQYPSQERPVVRIETQKGVELGAATTDGILFLGRTAQSGPCRVLYYLGPTPLEESGVIRPAGGVYFRAEIQLKHQSAPLLAREPTPEDPLVAMVFAGREVLTLPLRLWRGDGVAGSLLEWPGRPLPAGTPVFTPIDGRYHLVGLVAGKATIDSGGQQRELLVYAGMDRLREMLHAPTVYPPPKEVIFRPDDIWTIEEKRIPPPGPPPLPATMTLPTGAPTAPGAGRTPQTTPPSPTPPTGTGTGTEGTGTTPGRTPPDRERR